MQTIKERADRATYKPTDRHPVKLCEAIAFARGYEIGATEQKAIDEEVRLKKCDDMTEAEYEREVAFADWYHQNGEGTATYSDAIEWARKAVIEKACEWFGTCLMEIGYPDDWLRDSPNIKSKKSRSKKSRSKVKRSEKAKELLDYLND